MGICPHLCFHARFVAIAAATRVVGIREDYGAVGSTTCSCCWQWTSSPEIRRRFKIQPFGRYASDAARGSSSLRFPRQVKKYTSPSCIAPCRPTNTESLRHTPRSAWIWVYFLQTMCRMKNSNVSQLPPNRQFTS